jgi:hypothetical protein
MFISGIWPRKFSNIIQGYMREGGIKENGGGGEFKYDILIHCKNFCKCHNVSPPSTAINKE